MKQRTILIVALICAGCGAVGAVATDFTFRVQSGAWSDQFNWDPFGVPGADDTATIPTGRECRIEDADAHIRQLTVNGRLVLKNNHTLTLHAAAANDLVVNGTLAFQDQTALLTTYDVVAMG